MNEELVRRIVDAEKRLERLQSREVRRFITDYDWHRGWKDDFLGQAIHEQYTAVSDILGVGSGGALQNNFHGGAYRLTAGAANNAFHRLWLGNAADGFATLDADLGWVMIARFAVLDTGTAGNFMSVMGTANSAFSRYILAGVVRNVVANNWGLLTSDGVATATDSGVAFDASQHEHALEVYPIAGGLRQVDYFLDGILLLSKTTNIPTEVLTPTVYPYALTANQRRIDLDFCGVIPRSLA